MFARERPIEIGYTCISLFFGKATHTPTLHTHSGASPVSDSAAFTVIIGAGLKSGLGANAVGRPSIVKTIVQDATIYFFMIFSSHLVFVLTLVFARVSIRCNRSHLTISPFREVG